MRLARLLPVLLLVIPLLAPATAAATAPRVVSGSIVLHDNDTITLYSGPGFCLLTGRVEPENAMLGATHYMLQFSYDNVTYAVSTGTTWEPAPALYYPVVLPGGANLTVRTSPQPVRLDYTLKCYPYGYTALMIVSWSRYSETLHIPVGFHGVKEESWATYHGVSGRAIVSLGGDSWNSNVGYRTLHAVGENLTVNIEQAVGDARLNIMAGWVPLQGDADTANGTIGPLTVANLSTTENAGLAGMTALTAREHALLTVAALLLSVLAGLILIVGGGRL